MLCTILLNGALGFAVVIASPSASGISPPPSTAPPATTSSKSFFNATHSFPGSSALTAVLIALVPCASFGFLASAARQTWAFARDRGLPFPASLAHVCHLFRRNYHPCSDRPALDKVDHRSAISLRAVAVCGRLRRPRRPHQHRLHRRLQRHRLPHRRRPVRVLPHRHRLAAREALQWRAYPLGPVAPRTRGAGGQYVLGGVLTRLDRVFVLPARGPRHARGDELVGCGVWGGGAI